MARSACEVSGPTMMLTGSPVKREMTKTAMEMPMMMIIE
jgi:hypothetical protein